MKAHRVLLVAAAVLLMLSGGLLTAAQDGAPVETPVQTIELAGPAAEGDAEISGLAWYGDTLILMTENPNIYAGEGEAGRFYGLTKAAIVDYLAAEGPAALEPFPIPIMGPDIVATVPGFDGFEAIAFVEDEVFLMIEAELEDESMRGYLVKGTVAPDLSSITLDLANMAELLPQSTFGNMSYESLFVMDGQLVTFYEINGAAVNAEPLAYIYDTDLQAQGQMAFPALEFRVTDATTLDENGMFWVMNYFFPGEDFLLPALDTIVELFGQGATHALFPHVERLVALDVTVDGIVVDTDTPAIQLELPGEDARNWEGIARLDDMGFLVVTDKYPVTILGFVPAAMSAPMAMSGDAAAGEALFAQCAGCHGAQDGTGPAVTGMGERAATRVEGQSAGDYLHESIVNPGAFVVDGYSNIMPANYGDSLTGQQVWDLVAYLLTQ